MEIHFESAFLDIMKQAEGIFLQIEFGRGSSKEIIKKNLIWDEDSLVPRDDSFVKLDLDKYLSILKEEYLKAALDEMQDHEKMISMKVIAKMLCSEE